MNSFDKIYEADFNAILGNNSPLARIEKIERMYSGSLIMTTSGGKHSAVLPHLVRRATARNIPIVFVDTQHYTKPTYDMIDYFKAEGYDVRTFRSKYSQEELEAKYPGWWNDTARDFSQAIFDDVVRKIKHDPLEKAFTKLSPHAWLSGLTSFKTQERKSKSIVEYNHREIMKFHPIINWDEEEIEQYIQWHSLPRNEHHFDVTKGMSQNNECGIHTTFGE